MSSDPFPASSMAKDDHRSSKRSQEDTKAYSLPAYSPSHTPRSRAVPGSMTLTISRSPLSLLQLVALCPTIFFLPVHRESGLHRAVRSRLSRWRGQRDSFVS